MSINGSAVLLSVVATAVGIAIGSSVGNAGSNSGNAVTAACYHTGVSDYWCPDSSMRFNPDARYELWTTTRAGRQQVTLPPGVDAIFLTKEATERFLLSYYWATNKAKAEALMRSLTLPAASGSIR